MAVTLPPSASHSLTATTSARLLSSVVSIVFILLSAGSCESPAKQDRAAEIFCDSLQSEFESAGAAVRKELWRNVRRRATSDSLRHLRRTWFEHLHSDGALARIDQLQSVASDSLVRRRLTVTRKRILIDLLRNDPEISRIVDSLRPPALGDGGKSPASFTELRSDTIPLLYRRREIYHQLAGSRRNYSSAVIRLARLRNQRSQALGYNSLLDLNLELSGVSRDDLNHSLAVIDSATVALYKRLLKRIGDTLSHHRLEEADLYFYQFRVMSQFRRDFTRTEALEFALETITNLGINIRFEPVFIDSSGNLTGAPWLIAPHPPDDIRLLYATSQAPASDSEIEELLGSLGQGVRLLSTVNQSFIFREASDPLREMSARQLFVALLDRRELQNRFARISASQYEAFASAMVDVQLLRLRRLLALIHFELALYDNPNREFQDVYKKIVSDIMYVKADKHYQFWASRGDFLLNPATQFCHLYSMLITAQIYSAALREYGTLADNPQFGKYLQRTYFESGAGADWFETLLLGAGEKLDVNYFLDRFSGNGRPQ